MLKVADWRAVFIACGSLLCIGGAIWIVGVSGLKPYIKTMSERNLQLLKVNLVSDKEDNIKPSLTLKLFFGTLIFTVP